MDAKTLEALNGSIEKWRSIVAAVGADEGSENCPLCQMFNNDESELCVGCPVFEKTSSESCGNTPYMRWLGVTSRTSALGGRWATTEIAKEIALEELHFLESLLPRAVNPSVTQEGK